MSYIVFGTGKYCLKYCKYIDFRKILCFVDNDESKVGSEINGKAVCSVQRLLQVDYEYVIVLVRDYSEIMEQLFRLNISPQKIIPYNKLYDIEPALEKLRSGNNENNITQWVNSKSGTKIFVCIHELSRTGVPVALMNLTILLKKMGYHVLLAAFEGGTLEEELCENEIDFLSDMEGIYSSKKFLEEVKAFDIIILGTLMVANVGAELSNLDIPIVWWMHESNEWSFQNCILPINRGNIHYYGGGNKVLQMFSEYYPDESMDELLYFLPDIQVASHNYSEMRVFAMIGTFDKRKAQDVLISSIKSLSDGVREKCIFYFVGAYSDDDKRALEDLRREVEQVRYIYEMSQSALAEFYRQIDVLICPSRDDPMPIVVAQALQNYVPCIISDRVGQCKYLNEIGGGAVFTSEDTIALKQQIERFAFCSVEELEKCSQKAREVFDLHFSEELMKQNIINIFNKILLD